MFFNERFEFVQKGSTALRVQGAGNGQTPLLLTNIKAPKNGYCYVYLSNESNEMVYFDNFKVTHNRGRIIEENHYYSYGLKIAAISSTKVGDAREGHLTNKHLYNDKELIDDGDFGWYDYGFRNYDPQIGRFPQLDPLTFDYPFLTSYQYAGNDPITNVDLHGLMPWPGNLEALIDAAKTISSKVMPNFTISVVRKAGSAGSLIWKARLAAQAASLFTTISQTKDQICSQCPNINPNIQIKQPEITFTPATISQMDMSYTAQQRRREWTEFYEGNRARQGATMDPIAGQIAWNVLTTAKETVQSPIHNGYNFYQSVKEGDGWKAAGFGALLIMDMGPIKGGGGILKVFKFTRHGELTNGVYTVSKEAMKKHVFGGIQGKSIFYPTINADEAVLRAAQYADEVGLWVGNKAKVPVLNTNVGTLGNGQPTNFINVYRNSTGSIHGSPGN